jgi:hypothetical protein
VISTSRAQEHDRLDAADREACVLLTHAEWLERGATLVPPGGSVWVLLAKQPPPESEGAEIAEDVLLCLAGTDVPRRAVRYKVTH